MSDYSLIKQQRIKNRNKNRYKANKEGKKGQKERTSHKADENDILIFKNR
jgi:hypothetical protein